MSHNSANLTSIADSLWRELLRSHLNVAAVGVIMIILSAAATFGLRHYAIELATINTPITIATGHLETGVQKSIANLRGWMSIDNPRFVNDRNKVWADEIYPAIEELKRLKKNDVRSQKSLSTLETELYDLDMWQWLIEDVAQTPGNTPANALVELLIEPLTSIMFTAITAMVDIAISTKDSTTLRSLLNLRTVLYQVDNHLLRFINQGTQFDKGIHKKLLSRIDRYALRLIFANPGREMDKEEQLIIFKNALVAYHALTEEAILIRESADWNVSHFLLASTVLPLEQKISRQLNAISKNEQMKATHVAAMVNQIGWWIPLVTATLFLLMLYISYRMAKKESQVFIQPVIELETAKEKITQSLAEANALSRTLMQHEERTRTIVDSSPAGIITITQQGSIQSFNAAAERLFGYTSEQVMNKNVSMLMPVNQAMQHDGYLRNFLRTRESKIIGMGRELVGLHSDGTEVDIFLSISEIRFGDSKLFLGMVTDISDQVTQRRILVDANEELQASSEELQAQQEELRVANEELVVNAKALEMSQQQTELKANELEETSRYKSEFMANMSHELRTPLNSLLILSNALSENDEGNLSADEVESATVVRDSGKHLLELINEILNLSKVEAGKMVIENTHITLSVLSTALNSRFKHMATDKEIGFSINISEVTTEFVSDESMLSHILSNLISNAIKFTTQGEVKLDINSVESSTILEGQDKLLAFSVIDTGIGIAKEQQSTVFEAFQQVDGSTNRQYGGTGLGLSIVESYTELLGGTIELKSELGQGSTFTLYLPETPAIENKEDRDTPKGHNIVPFELKSSPPPFDDDRDTLNPNSALFLIIEDDVKFARILFETCHQQHAQAIIAPDGETGINLARTNKYTGIILDYMLPGLDGKSVLAVLESDPITRHIPVHVISA
ncbi:MAG: ATP-binding protein, partial [Methylococcales bacterium]